jgi:hypothetical protein
VEVWRGVGTTGGRAWERRGTFSLVSLVCSFWFVWFKFIGSSSSVLVDHFFSLKKGVEGKEEGSRRQE